MHGKEAYLSTANKRKRIEIQTKPDGVVIYLDGVELGEVDVILELQF